MYAEDISLSFNITLKDTPHFNLKRITVKLPPTLPTWLYSTRLY